jgi:hypothetical protein
VALKEKNIFPGMNYFRHFLAVFLISFFLQNAWGVAPELELSAKPVSCYGKSDGSITINLFSASLKEFEIFLFDSLSKQVVVFNQTMKLPFQQLELSAGVYNVRLSVNGKATDHPVLVEGPEELKANKINIEEIDGNTANAIVTIKANPSGGTPPYEVEWSENSGNQKGILARNLPMGVYRCTIDDNNHCGPVSATIFLFETEIEKYLRNREN